MEFILGITTEVAQFDKARQRHKQWPKNRFYFEEYMDKLADMETKLSKQQQQFRDQLAQWERECFVKNNCKVATQSDIASSPPAKLLVEKLKYAKTILNKFKAWTRAWTYYVNIEQPSEKNIRIICRATRLCLCTALYKELAFE